MITHPSFAVDSWTVREERLDLAVMAQTESVFALSNGHIGLRGNLDEGEPHGLPGTYLNSVYERRPLPYAEAGYGYPDAGETVINVTNGKLIRLLVDDEPFDVRYGRLVRHRRVLDMRAGTLRREVGWVSPAGTRVEVRSTRLVSLTHRSVAAVCYEIEALDATRVVVQSELVANEALPGSPADPRAAAALESPLVLEESSCFDRAALMVHRTRESGLRIGAGMDHELDAADGASVSNTVVGDVARLTVASPLDAGRTLRLVKYVAYGWSSERSRPAVRDQVVAALAGARQRGWDGLVSEQRSYLDDFWAGADVEVDGDPQVQQAVRFGLFHIAQSAARAEQRPIPAKGLTGPGYDGHTFWDSEMYVLPVLTCTIPHAAADALAWRASTLPLAEARAAGLGLDGAAFAWRTITGAECSGYWPAGTAAFHINADIAEAAVRYVEATGDAEFERTTALRLLVGTARMWRGLGQHDAEGRFRIDGVTGPDEYSAVADNNVYTNLMARRNLRAAAEAAARWPVEAGELGVGVDESAAWRRAADAVTIPYDERLGVHPQSEGFTNHAQWDFESTRADQYPLMLHFPYFDLYRKQVVKQADLVLAMMVCPEEFTAEQKLRNFDYYEAITVRDSSLSASTQAVVAAEVGHLSLAYDYLREAALMDLDDIEHNTRDGLHLAALAGAWTALVAGFGGMRTEAGQLSFAPRLPEGLDALRLRLHYRGRRLSVELDRERALYRLLEGEPMRLVHHGEEVQLDREVVARPIPRPEMRPRPRQPKGREPTTHGPATSPEKGTSSVSPTSPR
ncbi:MAG TPA: glycosyl hydrolase family 65 protein [Acidimicrobiales bacterium]|nr:glycosyl hydrolase family 65 protein [Acidimicrobiales bacterium]